MCQPGWEGVWGRMNTCICTAESLHRSPETITTSSIGYTLIQNFFGVKKKLKRILKKKRKKVIERFDLKKKKKEIKEKKKGVFRFPGI